jgi:site-specific DNA recombinase
MLRISDKKHVGVWIRVSTEDQVKGESPEHHESRARYYAEAKGWEIVEIYRLDAISGKTVKETPAAKQMLEDIKSGHITGLIFSKLARLARNTKELLEFADIFREYNADLISLGESIDTSSPAGRLFYTMIAAMAQWEREEISARISASVPIRARMGKRISGQATFGYQWKDGKLIPHPDESPIRKLIYELYKEHGRLKTVARLLNEKGYRTRSGANFADSTVDRLLRDPTAKGLRRANYTKSHDSTKSWQYKPESEWVYTPVEAIISEELWDECNVILESHKSKERRPAKKVAHLFSGVVFCACGGKMYVPYKMYKYTCQKCRSKVPVDDLERVFQEQLKNFFFSPQEIAKYLDKASADIREKELLLQVLQRESTKLSAEIDNLLDLYQSGAIDKRGVERKYYPMADRLRQLEEEIPRIQAEVDVIKINHINQEEIVASARDLYSHWSDLPAEEKRHIVESITDRIVIHAEEVEMNLFYAPPPPATPIVALAIHSPPLPLNQPETDRKLATHSQGRAHDRGPGRRGAYPSVARQRGHRLPAARPASTGPALAARGPGRRHADRDLTIALPVAISRSRRSNSSAGNGRLRW